MSTQYSIDDIKRLFSDRAGTRGISSNVTPEKFNRWINSAEIKFFNTVYDMYSKKQTISDSISKWMSDPMYLPVNSNGIFPFFPNMNLLHVDSMSNYLPVTGTMIATFGAITPGSGYTNATYANISLSGGTGSGATAFISVVGGVVVSCIPMLQGSGYAVSDSLTGTFGGGTGFSVVIATLTGATDDNAVTRVEKQLWAANLSSSYDSPNQQFPIYTQYSTHFEYAPKSIGYVKIVYLQQPVWSYWAYTLNGYIATLTGLIGGSEYATPGIYTNVPLLSADVGNGALATITVSGGLVTSVVLTNPGKVYQNNEVLTANNSNLGGSGVGFSITVSSLVAGSIRPIYDPINSVQPKWNNDDVSTIIDISLADAAVASRDKELTTFSEKAQKSQQ